MHWAQSCAALQAQAMYSSPGGRFSVYEVSYVTQRGTRRYYVGCSDHVDERGELELKKGPKQPDWVKPWAGQWQFSVLRRGLTELGNPTKLKPTT